MDFLHHVQILRQDFLLLLFFFIDFCAILSFFLVINLIGTFVVGFDQVGPSSVVAVEVVSVSAGSAGGEELLLLHEYGCLRVLASGTEHVLNDKSIAYMSGQD